MRYRTLENRSTRQYSETKLPCLAGCRATATHASSRTLPCVVVRGTRTTPRCRVANDGSWRGWEAGLSVDAQSRSASSPAMRIRRTHTSCSYYELPETLRGRPRRSGRGNTIQPRRGGDVLHSIAGSAPVGRRVRPTPGVSDRRLREVGGSGVPRPSRIAKRARAIARDVTGTGTRARAVKRARIRRADAGRQRCARG
jgi:hypothetical protein